MKDQQPTGEMTPEAQQQKLRAFYAACPPISLFRERLLGNVEGNLEGRALSELTNDDLNELHLKSADDTARRATELVGRTRKDALEAVARAEITEVAKGIVNGLIAMTSIFGIANEMPVYGALGMTPESSSLGIFSPDAYERKRIERYLYLIKEQDLLWARMFAQEAARNRNWDRIEQNRLAHEEALATLGRHAEQFRELYGEDLLPTPEPPMDGGPFSEPPGRQ